MPLPTDPPNPDSTRALTAYALRFLGLIVTCAGALALIRTGERSIFYALLMPIGLVMWGTGFFMTKRNSRDAGS